MPSTTVQLNNGQKMPLIGLGLWKVPQDKAADLVYTAIKLGYRGFDDAAIYGNEKEVGEGFARAIKDGLVKREDLFVISKLWCTFHEPHRVEEALKRTLSDLQLDYLDLYYIHFPWPIGYVDPAVRYPNDWTDEYTPGTTPLHATWAALEQTVEKGLTRAIAVSNYNVQTFSDLLRYAKIKPAALQIELHPYLTNQHLIDTAKAHGVQVVSYSTFGPASFIELDLQRAKDAVPLFENEAIKAIAQRHGKTPAQVLLRWCTQRGVAVIPKSSSEGRLTQNLDSAGFDLTEEEIKEIGGLNRNLRFNDPLDDNVPIPVFD